MNWDGGLDARLELGWTSSVIICLHVCLGMHMYALSTHLKHNGKKRVNLSVGNIHTDPGFVRVRRRGG